MGPNQKKAILPVWSALAATPRCCLIEEHEKPVYRCLLDYDWELEQKYRFTVREGREESEGTWWIGEILDSAHDQTAKIGEALLPFSFGRMSAHNYYTCVEYGLDEECESLPHTRARFSGHYAYNGKEDGPAYLRAEEPKIEYPKCRNAKVTILRNAAYMVEAGSKVER